MTVVDCALYRDGKRIESTHNVARMAAEARSDPNAFVWVGLFEPTAEELQGVAVLFGLHPLAVDDAVRAHQRPKAEVYDHSLFVVLRTLGYVDQTSEVLTGEIAMFVGEDYVVTVRHGATGGLAGVRSRLESEPHLLSHGPAAVLYAVADAVVDEYLMVADELQVDVDEVEASVFSDLRSDDFETIYKLKRELQEMRRAVQPLIGVFQSLAGTPMPGVPEAARPFFRDVYDHLLRAQEQIDSMDLLLSSILQAHLAQVGLRQNEDMRRLAAWAAIFAVITAIAGIYGMNFQYMPELGWRWGYPLVLLVMGGTAFGLFRLFKRSGWL